MMLHFVLLLHCCILLGGGVTCGLFHTLLPGECDFGLTHQPLLSFRTWRVSNQEPGTPVCIYLHNRCPYPQRKVLTKGTPWHQWWSREPFLYPNYDGRRVWCLWQVIWWSQHEQDVVVKRRSCEIPFCPKASHSTLLNLTWHMEMMVEVKYYESVPSI